MEFDSVIGLEIHAELATRTKMFCACQVVDSTVADPNIAVCPVCAAMPGVLPVVNRKAVEYALRVALALECEIASTSIFARKNYFYPDLPKGYQISQYEQPLARNGRLCIQTSAGERVIRVRRVHLEEDTGKLTHVRSNGEPHSLVDLNRAGVPLLEIVSEPDLRTAEEVRAYAEMLRAILRYLGVNSGDMQKGVMRIEPNISLRLVGTNELGTRTEIKNLNSFRALERSVAYEIERQAALLREGGQVIQQTMGWDEVNEVTVPQRGKEEAHDYRYFPEPDLPPLFVDPTWLDEVRSDIPELPTARHRRFREQYQLSEYDAQVLTSERSVADYFEKVVQFSSSFSAKQVANWISGELFGLLNQAGLEIDACKVSPENMSMLLQLLVRDEINQTTAKKVLSEMFETGDSADDIVTARGLRQVSDISLIADIVTGVLADNPDQVRAYLQGKESLFGWFFGQVMRQAKGKANPQVVRSELEGQLNRIRTTNVS